MQYVSVPFTGVEKFVVTDWEVAQTKLPLGFWPLLDELRVLATMFPERTWSVGIDKGLFRPSVDARSDCKETGIINRVCQSLASSSSKLCMECGRHGFRRKNEEGWPCLCTQHYIQFATELTNYQNNAESNF